MYRIRIILVLFAIIPSLDCCSSRTLIQRNHIDLYRTMELSLEKNTHFPQEAPSSPAQVTTAVQSTLSHGSHRPHHRHSHASAGDGGGSLVESTEESEDDGGENLKLNRSHESSIMQPQQPPLQSDEQNQQHHHQQQISTPNGSETVTVTDDGQQKFMDEVILLECVDWYRLEFCLNGGRCLIYPILNHSLWFCECAGDYVGERCEAKTPEKIPPTIRPRYVLAKTIGGPLVLGLAFMDILLLLFLFCKNSNRN